MEGVALLGGAAPIAPEAVLVGEAPLGLLAAVEARAITLMKVAATCRLLEPVVEAVGHEVEGAARVAGAPEAGRRSGRLPGQRLRGADHSLRVVWF